MKDLRKRTRHLRYFEHDFTGDVMEGALSQIYIVGKFARRNEFFNLHLNPGDQRRTKRWKPAKVIGERPVTCHVCCKNLEGQKHGSEGARHGSAALVCR